VAEYCPGVLVFLGKRPAEEFLGGKPEWGVQPERLGDTVIVVAPDPSPANGHFERLKHVWLQVSRCVG
jgi:hypothetical protein